MKRKAEEATRRSLRRRQSSPHQAPGDAVAQPNLPAPSNPPPHDPTCELRVLLTPLELALNSLTLTEPAAEHPAEACSSSPHPTVDPGTVRELRVVISQLDPAMLPPEQPVKPAGEPRQVENKSEDAAVRELRVMISQLDPAMLPPEEQPMIPLGEDLEPRQVENSDDDAAAADDDDEDDDDEDTDYPDDFSSDDEFPFPLEQWLDSATGLSRRAVSRYSGNSISRVWKGVEIPLGREAPEHVKHFFLSGEERALRRRRRRARSVRRQSRAARQQRRARAAKRAAKKHQYQQ